MATKTITIDMEAHTRLKRVKKDHESFSETIKRVVRPPLDVREWMKKISKTPLSSEAVEAVEEKIRARRSRAPQRER